MFCQRCGTQLDGTAKFCGNCGARTPLNNDPAVLSSSAVSPEISAAVAIQALNSHVRVMGILWAIYSGFRILMALWTIVFSRLLMPMLQNFIPHDSDVDVMPIFHMMSGFYIVSGIFSVLAGAVGFWAAWALLKHQPNGRILALVVAVISLISIPFGTALGVYTLVVLLPAKADQTYQQLAAAA
jgi:zinc-ribbon domain